MLAAAQYEIKKWDIWFSDALQGKGQESEHGFFWEYCEQDGHDIMQENLELLNQTNIHIAELACGAGRVSISLAQQATVSAVTLLDGSTHALAFAKTLIPDEVFPKFTLVHGNLFANDLPDNQFDVTWNSGVIEHYHEQDVKLIITEMLRVTKPGGRIIVAIPNRRSLAALKAYLLGKTAVGYLMKWVSGYRYDTEIPYSTADILTLISSVIQSEVTVSYAGSPVWVAAPRSLVLSFGKLGKPIGCSFMTYFSFTKI